METAKQELTLDRARDELPTDYDAPEAAILNDDIRTKTSSFENIYQETSLDAEVMPEKLSPEEIDIGDRFDTKHAEPHLKGSPEKLSSSFENLYEEAAAAQDQLEKDVDEKAFAAIITTSEYERDVTKSPPAKTPVLTLLGSDGQAAGARAVSFDQQDMAAPQSSVSPIDLTFEHGLDKLGHEEKKGSGLLAVLTRDHVPLDRSQSMDTNVRTVEDPLRTQPVSEPKSSPQGTA